MAAPRKLSLELFSRILAVQVVLLVLCLLVADAAYWKIGIAAVLFAGISYWLSFPILSDLEFTFEKLSSERNEERAELIKDREELSAIVSGISEPVIAIDADGRAFFYNGHFSRLFGSPKLGQSVLAETFRNPELLNAFRQTLASGTAQQINIHLDLREPYSTRHFSVLITPLKREDGATYGAVGAFHDVTELKRAERVRIDFVANVSHELRTPLTAIKGYSDTLSADVRQNRTDSLLKFVEVIQKNSDRLMALIDDLLDLSSLESGTDLKPSMISLKEFTGRIISQLESRATAKKQSIVLECKAEALIADPRRVEQVLVNLIENAIKYVPEGGKVQVIWEKSATSTVLRVIDNGPGVPPESLPRLFERFYRVDKARARELGGTGLGLAIVKHILRRHGGSVRVKSEPGKGAEFVCEFPLHAQVS